MTIHPAYNPDLLIETPRLLIRHFQAADEQGMFEMDSDPEVHKYLWQQPVTKREEIKPMMDFVMQQYYDHGIGRWAVIEKETGDVVGWTGFKRMKTPVNGHVDHLDFGYRQAQRFWGRGYATEAGQAALDYGIKQMGFKDIYGMTDIDNNASRRVLEKLGFKYIETFAFDGGSGWQNGKPVTWYQF